MSNIQSQRWLLSRRYFLRGRGTTMALPLLNAMTPLRLSAPLQPLQKMEVTAETFVDSLGPVSELV